MCPAVDPAPHPSAVLPTLADVAAAAEGLAGIAARTPVLSSRTLDERFGCALFFKAENLQRTGSFKFRGAYHLVSGLSAPEQAAGLVTSSAGNHAQAVALAARLTGTAATVLMPRDAPAEKRRATLRLGAEVVGFDRYAEDPDELLRELAHATGATVVHPYDDPRIVAGAGTTALELVDEVGHLDTCLVPVGGGGLLAGFAVATSPTPDGPALVGVEPATSDDWARSLAAGARVRVDVRPGIADGQQLGVPGELTFAVAAARLERVVTVDDDQTRAAMTTLMEELNVIVEPSGATAFAALLSGAVDLAGQRVGVVLSGGNMSLRRLARTLDLG